ncbi:MAG TPA: FAD:protein FMN transferase [Gammaproteobacteria bacterium]
MLRASINASLALVCVSALCCARPPADGVLRERLLAMGTWVDIVAVLPVAREPRAVLADIEGLLRSFERDYYPWADGELAALNRAIAAGESHIASPELAALLEQAQTLSARSDGLFEPGLGALVELWGFHAGSRADQRLPSNAAIERLLTGRPGIEALKLVGRRVSADGTSLMLDLGGIAKGVAVGRVLSLLERRGFRDALVNAGGDLAAIGRAAGGEAERRWRIGIRHPRQDSLLGVVELDSGEAAFTSGDYERYFDYQGRRWHHILDPETGRPVSHTQALTVIDTDPVTADAAATALFVAGPDRWRGIANELGVDCVLRVDASGEIEMTDAMSARFRSQAGNHDILIGAT